LAVVRIQFIDGFVKNRGELLPLGITGCVKRIHFDGIPFACMAATLLTQHAGGYEARMPVQPSAKQHVRGERASFPGEIGEYGLRHILGQLRIAVDAAQRYGVDEVNVPGDEFAKSGFGTVLDILPEKRWGVRHVCLLQYKAAPNGNPTENFKAQQSRNAE